MCYVRWKRCPLWLKSGIIASLIPIIIYLYLMAWGFFGFDKLGESGKIGLVSLGFFGPLLIGLIFAMGAFIGILVHRNGKKGPF